MAKTKVEPVASLCSSLEVDAVAFHALAKTGDDKIKQAELRPHLADGQSYPIDLHVLGKVDNKVVRLHVDGTLNVGHSDPNYPCSSAPNATRILTFLLQCQSAELSDQNLLLVEGSFGDGCEPEISPQMFERVETLMTKLRRQSTRFQNGPVKLLYSLRKSDQKLA